MISDIYELILAIYMAIMFFFLGWYSMGDYFSVFMEDTVLNKIFITFFIIVFFLLGYLFQNIFISFKETKKREFNSLVNVKN
jgi:Kef-type K+ transport system membrane component KefB